MVNWNLIRCAFGYHKFSEWIDSALHGYEMERVCKRCGKLEFALRGR